MGSSGTLSPALAGAIGSIGPKNAFMDPNSIVVEYSTDSGSTWTEWDIGDTMKKGIVNPAGSPNPYFRLGGPNAQRNVSYQSRITFKADNLYSSIVGIYLWIVDYSNTVVCDVERSTIGDKTTFTKIVEGKRVSGWGGPNWISLSPMTWGGDSSQTSNGYAIRLTFRYTAVSTSGVSKVGEIALIGVTNWNISDNMACRGHMYTWDTSKNVSFPANVKAPTFSGNGSALTSLNASNLTSGTVPLARIPTGTTSSTVALGDHTHSYAGSPSAGGSANALYSPRISTTANYKPGANRSEMREFEDGVANTPTNSYYHILTTEGPDAAYATQLAMGMTTTNIAYRNLNADTWSAWQTILTSGNYKTYCTPANIGAATSGHTHSNYLTTSGTAAAATKLATARTIALSGDVTGSTSFNGTANVTIATTVADNSHSHSNSTITSLDAGKITSGTLPIARGGTGQTTLALMRNAAGLGNTTGALPVANGGTGATAKRQAKINLGITAGTGAAPSSGTYGDIYIQYT